MVDNCVSVNTPDFRVIANTPDLTKTTKDYINTYSSLISNYFSEYSLNIAFKDKYNNEVVPVSWIKKITIINRFENTLWKNQTSITNASLWDGVWFKFTDKNWTILNFTNSNNNYFSKTLTIKSELPWWELNTYIKSWVPTYNEYKTASNNPWWANQSLYWSDLSAKLKYSEFKINVENLLSYNWLWEYTTTNNSFVGILPEFKFNPVVSFNYIWNIFPIIEWQEKNMDIKNVVTDNTNLSKFNLNMYTWTNNSFLQILNSNLKNWNLSSWNWNSTYKYNNYKIKDAYQSYALANWKMDYSWTDTFRITPQTIWWITNVNSKIALYSNLSYTTNWLDVILPWIQTWFNYYWNHTNTDFSVNSLYDNKSSIIFSEIQITWITQTKNKDLSTNWEWSIVTNNASTTFNDFSKITLYNIKTDINKNVASLIKWNDLSKASVWATNSVININNINNFNSTKWLSLKSNNVLYIKNRDVVINCWLSWCWITWNKTIVIENWNLRIDSDLYYTDKNSVFWIILIWNKSNWNTSQLQINERVTNWVWIVYAEWPIVSVNNIWEIYNWSNVWSNISNQLYWKWSFATKNTVWWSINLSKLSCPYWTPEYDTISCTNNIAQAYDLIYLRRYARVDELTYYWTINDPMWDSKVPVYYDTKNIKISWWRTITKNWSMDSWNSNLIKSNNLNSPLIIDYDPQIVSNPPYVFEK